MSFAALVTGMTATLMSSDSGVAEPAVLTPSGAGTPVPLTAVIDEPSEAAFPGIPQPPLRDRRIILTLPLPAAAGVTKGWHVVVTLATGTRAFTIDSVYAKDPDLIKVYALEARP